MARRDGWTWPNSFIATVARGSLKMEPIRAPAATASYHAWYFTEKVGNPCCNAQILLIRKNAPILPHPSGLDRWLHHVPGTRWIIQNDAEWQSSEPQCGPMVIKWSSMVLATQVIELPLRDVHWRLHPFLHDQLHGVLWHLLTASHHSWRSSRPTGPTRRPHRRCRPLEAPRCLPPKNRCQVCSLNEWTIVYLKKWEVLLHFCHKMILFFVVPSQLNNLGVYSSRVDSRRTRNNPEQLYTNYKKPMKKMININNINPILVTKKQIFNQSTKPLWSETRMKLHGSRASAASLAGPTELLMPTAQQFQVPQDSDSTQKLTKKYTEHVLESIIYSNGWRIDWVFFLIRFGTVFLISFLIPIALYLQQFETRTCQFCLVLATFGHVHLPFCTALVFATF